MSATRARKRLLVTGGTGFVGSHFLYQALEEPLELVALARARDAAHAKARVLDAVATAAAAYERTIDRRAVEPRLAAVAGDITQPRCGLDEATLAALAEGGVDEVWHVAASLRYEERRRAEIERENVHGTRCALELARALGARRFVHVSTAYTVGRRAGEVDETLHPLEGPFNNVYEETKCRAEHEVVRFCGEHEITYRILRPSIVMGPLSTLRPGGGDTGVYGFARELHRSRDVLARVAGQLVLIGDADVRLDLVPVDSVARDMVHVACDRAGDASILHLVAGDGVPGQLIVDLLHEGLELPALRLAPDRGERPPSPLEALLDRRTDFYGGYLARTKRFVRSLAGGATVTATHVRGWIEQYLQRLRQIDRDTLFSREVAWAPDGTPLAVFEAGDRERETVVLVNAYGMPADFWGPLSLELREHYHVVTWETRGLPDTTAAFDPGRVGVDHHAADMAAVMDALAVERAHVVGWCSGAQVALRFAAQHPERVATLALLSGSYRLPATVPTTTFQKHLGVVLGVCSRSRAHAQRYSDLIFGNQDDEAGRAMLTGMLTTTDPALLHLTSGPFRTGEALYRYGHMFLGVQREPEDAWTSGVRAPTLVVTGARDDVAHPAGSHEVARRIPRARLVEREDGDHFLLYHDRELAPLLRELFGGGVPGPDVARAA